MAATRTRSQPRAFEVSGAEEVVTRTPLPATTTTPDLSREKVDRRRWTTKEMDHLPTPLEGLAETETGAERTEANRSAGVRRCDAAVPATPVGKSTRTQLQKNEDLRSAKAPTNIRPLTGCLRPMSPPAALVFLVRHEMLYACWFRGVLSHPLTCTEEFHGRHCLCPVLRGI